MELGTPTIRRYGDLRVAIHHDAAAAGPRAGRRRAEGRASLGHASRGAVLPS